MSAKAPLYEPHFKVFYRKLPTLLGGGMDWPLLDIGLKHNKISIAPKLLALVDSGASNSILDPEIAKYLGFDLAKLPKYSGGTSASGSYTYWRLPDLVEVDINGRPYTTSFIVIDSSNQMWSCILGHDSIFRISKILFNTPKKFFKVWLRSNIN